MDRVRHLHRDDREEHRDRQSLDGPVSVERPAGVGRTEVEPRPDRGEPDDQPGQIEGEFEFGVA